MLSKAQTVDVAFCSSHQKSPHSMLLSPHLAGKKKTTTNKYVLSNSSKLFATMPDYSSWESIINGGDGLSGSGLTSLLMADMGDVQGYTSSMSPATTEFEPVVNVPSLVSFVIIAVVFSLLQIRINAVSSAAERRTNALAKLRKVKSLQLASTSTEEASESVSQALTEYEAALTEEMDLRQIAPGIRIAAPNDPKQMEEDVAAAKQFLGWDLLQDDAGEEGGRDSNGGSVSKSSKEMANPMSSSSVALLGFTGIVLVVLLFGLQFDPMTANNVFTSVEGVDPPMDMPLRSW